ncbi:MAG: glycoside hydrolase family 2 protein [Clostridiales bacterium]|jgi:beta-galactosidase|nr:glycoside hydrolase family 2 protein [Clostridiales bacterium]
MRNIFHLNFDWKYTPEYEEKMVNPKFNDENFVLVDIPHTNLELPYNYFDEKSYQFVSCYRKLFVIEGGKKNGKRYILHFEGAANYSRVFLNGAFVGEHKGAYTPFSFDITEQLNDGDNVLAVVLDSSERSEIPPFGNVVDYLVYGGIYREVWLEEVSDAYIESVFIRTKDVLNNKKLIETDVEFSESVSGDIKVILYDGEDVIYENKSPFSAKTVKLKWRIGGVTLWDTENPKLYTLKVIFGDDEKITRFGFRECKFKRDGFYLNGKKIKLFGLNRHQSYPYVGYAMPKSAQKADADFLKFNLGVNLARTSHYPNSVHFLDRCDEIGLLVFTEMPGWQFIGEGEWRDNCIDNVRRMVLRDRNHPSVILWGVRINEGADCDELYEITNSLARELDDTRQTGGVRNMPRSNLLEDVYTFNDFTHAGGKFVLLPAVAVTGLRAPYMVTEHNGHMYPTKSFDREQLRTEHALRHARVLNKAFGNSRISGVTGWCMSDYNTHKDFGSGDKICYHGVSDMFRIPKQAAAVYSSQQDKTPYMEVLSSMDIGEHPGGQLGNVWVFTNCDYVKLYKNGRYTSTAFPNYKRFPHLPHPPILADNFIGDALTSIEKLDERTAALLTDVLVAAFTHGFAMPPINYLKTAAAYINGRMSFSQIYDIVTKYIANWGGTQVVYLFEGYKDGNIVKTVTKTAVTDTHLDINADSLTLNHEDTYDVTRIELIERDQNDNRLPFSDTSIKISLRGPAAVIGPSSFPLIGGARAFWIRTNGEKGKVTVYVESVKYGKQKIELLSQ